MNIKSFVMTCEHIEEAKKKINNLIEKAGDSGSCLYQEKGPYVEWEEVKKYLESFKSSEFFHIERLTLALSLKVGKFQVITPNYDAFYDSLSDIFGELKSCDCRSKAYKHGVDKMAEEARNIARKSDEKYNELFHAAKDIEKGRDDLRKANDKLNREFRDLSNEKKEKEDEIKELKEKYDKEKLEWEKTKGDIQTEKARVEENLINSSSQVADLTKRLENSENQLSEKQKKIEELREERSFLREKLGTTGKEMIAVLEWEQTRRTNEIELFANQRRIELRQIKNLRRRYKDLIIAEENNDWNMFNEAEDNILVIKDNMVRIITIEEAQKISKKCKKIAKLELKLGRMREQQRQREQQYEARQEIPVNH